MSSFILNIIKQPTIIICVIIIIGLLSCKSSGITATPTESTPLLLFQKTPCLGTCPSYEALIHTDGTVRFVGWGHVPVTDTLTFRLTAQELQTLTKDIEALNYKSWQNLYKTEWTDMPATHLYFYETGKETKHIKHEEGGPEELILFIDKVHQLLWKYVATPDR